MISLDLLNLKVKNFNGKKKILIFSLLKNQKKMTQMTTKKDVKASLILAIIHLIVSTLVILVVCYFKNMVQGNIKTYIVLVAVVSVIVNLLIIIFTSKALKHLH